MPSRQQLLSALVGVLVVCVLYPLLGVLLLLPLWIHREVAKRLAKWRDPRLGPILSGISAHFAAHNTYSRPSVVLIPYYTFSERLSLDHISSVFSEQVLSRRRRNNNDDASPSGDYVFRQMRQRIVSRFGYKFWADVEPFEASPHVRHLHPEDPDARVEGTELVGLIQKLSVEPFDPRRSPWEVLLVSNFEDEEDPSVKCAVILRIHHCLADGFSISSLMAALGSSPWKDFRGRGKGAVEAAGCWSILWQSLRAILSIPYHVAMLMYFDADRNGWARRAGTSWEGNYKAKRTESFSLQELKALASRLGVSLPALLTCLKVGAIERGMRRMEEDDKIIPPKIQIALPWPLAGHPGVGNHHTGAILRVQLFPNEPLRTLKGIEEGYAAIRASSLPLANYYLTNLIGSWPSKLIPSDSSVVSSTAILTNFPLSTEKVDMFGCELKEFRIGGSIAVGYASDTCCLSYDGRVRFTTGGDSSIFPHQQDLEHFAASFRATLNSLKLEALRPPV